MVSDTQTGDVCLWKALPKGSLVQYLVWWTYEALGVLTRSFTWWLRIQCGNPATECKFYILYTIYTCVLLNCHWTITLKLFQLNMVICLPHKNLSNWCMLHILSCCFISSKRLDVFSPKHGWGLGHFRTTWCMDRCRCHSVRSRLQFPLVGFKNFRWGGRWSLTMGWLGNIREPPPLKPSHPLNNPIRWEKRSDEMMRRLRFYMIFICCMQAPKVSISFS